VQFKGLLGVHEQGRVEVAEPAPAPGLRQQDTVGGQHLLGDALGVLGGELQFLQRVAEPGAAADRVQQRVGRRPGPLGRLAGLPDEAVVKGHRDLHSGTGF
jgi:hypothetical protein